MFILSLSLITLSFTLLHSSKSHSLLAIQSQPSPSHLFAVLLTPKPEFLATRGTPNFQKPPTTHLAQLTLFTYPTQSVTFRRDKYTLPNLHNGHLDRSETSLP